MKLRNVLTEDYFKVTDVMDEWWGGRKMKHLLPRLFFDHFQQTSFVLEQEGELAGFLIGFYSQTNEHEAYIHFVGVNPTFRNEGLAKSLYEHFFSQVRGNGCRYVKCITTPVNEGSIKFHKTMGFESELIQNYAGENEDRVVFKKML